MGPRSAGESGIRSPAASSMRSAQRRSRARPAGSIRASMEHVSSTFASSSGSFMAAPRLEDPQEEALQVAGLWHAEEDGVIPAGAAPLEQLHPPPRVVRGVEDERLQLRLGHVIAARRGDEDATGLQDLHRAEVDFLLPTAR